MKMRRRVPDYTTPDWVHSLQEGTGPRFGEKPLNLKPMKNLGLGSPICQITLYWFPVASFPVQGFCPLVLWIWNKNIAISTIVETLLYIKCMCMMLKNCDKCEDH
jgi:hypothetical protein